MLRAMTQQRLAQLSKVSQSAIGNYESGLRSSSRSLLSLARALEINPLWLETGQGQMEPGGGPLLLRDEPHGQVAAPRPGEWLFDQDDYARYLQLNPHDKQILRQAVRSMVQGMLESIPTDPAEKTPGRRRPRRRSS